MILQLAALILLRTVSLVQTGENPHLISMRMVHVGESFTMRCQISEKEKSFYCHKQSLGYVVQTIAVLSLDKPTFSESVKDSRFQITKENNQFVLSISNVSKEDEATYFCQDVSTFSSSFVGTFLAVKDRCQNKTVGVTQRPETSAVQPGGSVSLQCSLPCRNKETSIQCPGEHRVYWFRAGSEGFHPGIVYTHKNRSFKHEDRSCVYSLSKTIQDSSDAGIYYCAVVTCGGILFGEGTTVETRLPPHSGSEPGPLVLTLGVLLAGCVIVIAILIFYIKQRGDCEHCEGQMSQSHHHGRDQPNLDQSNVMAMTYASLDFQERRVKRGTKKKRDTPQDCVYSDVHRGPVS
ncbi:uncharacterized protein LOC117818036 [Notolabrus celidotus]|uniref:uncharacterized protein LOC117818036 n=1 Tax=Notolabrus celidotus TaxID=1203425 RepID=UPI00148F6339|nr:uncharacterized protein LOC117818036 [Notolabrus celidotus]